MTEKFDKDADESSGQNSSPMAVAERIACLLLACSNGIREITPEQHPLQPQLEELSNVLQAVMSNSTKQAPSLAEELKVFFKNKKTEEECWALEKNEFRGIVLRLIQMIKEMATSSGGFDASLDKHIEKIQATESAQDILAIKDEIIGDAGKIQSEVSSLRGELEKYKDATTKLSQRLEQTEAKALIDPLTKVFNRTAYDMKMRQMVKEYARYKEPASLIVADIDLFKRFNDTCGHKAGDRILNAVASTMIETIRNTDQVFRYGGEEFVLLLAKIDLENTKKITEKVRQNVENCYVSFEGQKLKVTVSLGITAFKKKDTEITVFQRADSAMYKAKSNGRNRCEVVL